jgi:hypothetical protein
LSGWVQFGVPYIALSLTWRGDGWWFGGRLADYVMIRLVVYNMYEADDCMVVDIADHCSTLYIFYIYIKWNSKNKKHKINVDALEK